MTSVPTITTLAQQLGHMSDVVTNITHALSAHTEAITAIVLEGEKAKEDLKTTAILFVFFGIYLLFGTSIIYNLHKRINKNSESILSVSTGVLSKKLNVLYNAKVNTVKHNSVYSDNPKEQKQRHYVEMFNKNSHNAQLLPMTEDVEYSSDNDNTQGFDADTHTLTTTPS